MKDLMHLSYFEGLLQDSGNELVDKARAAGNVCMACGRQYEILQFGSLDHCSNARQSHGKRRPCRDIDELTGNARWRYTPCRVEAL